ncbi:MAG: N-acetylneuraminate synthase family protein [Magnetovibrio sp.]|nr:N-acetylneuraminate synthase family protein [Magnetovibrio sp.]
MHLFGKDLDTEIAIIAEIGVNHEGDFDAAIKLLRLAAGAGADAVKFQNYSPARYASASDPARLARVGSFCLDDDAMRALRDEANALDVAILSTPLSEDKIAIDADLLPAIKIASGDLTFEPAIRGAAASERPILLSTGLGTMDEINQAIAWFKDEAGTADIRDRLVLLHCVSAYPTPIEQANVLAVPFSAQTTGLRVGYSNHVIGMEACFGAIAHGACVIEVHFTDCKTGRAFRDHELSCEPSDLKMLVAMAPRIRQGLGTRSKVRQSAEQPLLEAVRKGVVAACELKAGHTLSNEDLMFARPATEFPADQIDTLIGKRITQAYKLGESIRRIDVEMD